MIGISAPEAADRVAALRITTHFAARLLDIERQLSEAGRPTAYHALLDLLNKQTIPLLQGTPRIGCRFVDEKQGPFERAVASPLLTDLLERGKAAGGELRVYTFGHTPPDHYVLFYLLVDDTVYLLSIRMRQ
ncbi:hypothetical protein AWB79_01549 [Caballeronia hypogeia]|uniref:Uncharacterized protein n=1 Tax=Caballeronia hypogeia TaxID=1777140 RepID=A0A157ZXQ2_9BURK|nr:hypothetical protein [Caballeronia hypogeia]SAK50216.1 hypothetical protein AWB79_01549 [Caballeronia hypogeia]